MAIIQTVIFGAAARFAYRQAREIQLTREDQTRPFVILDFDLSRPPFIHLVIKNIGGTMARQVRIQTDPPLASTFDKDRQSEPIAKLSVFTKEIPTMAPDREIRMLFDSFPRREEQKLDDVYRATVTYEGERGRSYVDEMVLDLGIYRNITYVEQHTIHDVHKELKKIATAVDRWGPVAATGRGSWWRRGTTSARIMRLPSASSGVAQTPASRPGKRPRGRSVGRCAGSTGE